MSLDPSSPKSKFTGIWIPAEVWTRQDLTIAEKALYGSIHALGGYSDEGCYASNQFLASRFQVSDGGIKNMVTALRKANLIEETVIKDGVRYIWLKQPQIRKLSTSMTPSSNDATPRHQMMTPPSSNDDLATALYIGTEKSIDKNKKAVVKGNPEEIPSHLRTPEVEDAWKNWVGNRKEIKKPLSVRASAANFVLLRDWGASDWVSSINASIANGWQGLFKPKFQVETAPKTNMFRSDSGPMKEQFKKLHELIS